MTESTETVDLVKNYSGAHMNKTNLEMKLDAAANARKPDENTLTTLSESLA